MCDERAFVEPERLETAPNSRGECTCTLKAEARGVRRGPAPAQVLCTMAPHVRLCQHTTCNTNSGAPAATQSQVRVRFPQMFGTVFYGLRKSSCGAPSLKGCAQTSRVSLAFLLSSGKDSRSSSRGQIWRSHSRNSYSIHDVRPCRSDAGKTARFLQPLQWRVVTNQRFREKNRKKKNIMYTGVPLQLMVMPGNSHATGIV